jgi:hypothetical protein
MYTKCYSSGLNLLKRRHSEIRESIISSSSSRLRGGGVTEIRCSVVGVKDERLKDILNVATQAALEAGKLMKVHDSVVNRLSSKGSSPSYAVSYLVAGTGWGCGHKDQTLQQRPAHRDRSPVPAHHRDSSPQTLPTAQVPRRGERAARRC